MDTHTVRTGFRTVEAKPEGLFINGEKIKVVGLNRHQSFPYVGYALGKRVQEKGREIFKGVCKCKYRPHLPLYAV